VGAAAQSAPGLLEDHRAELERQLPERPAPTGLAVGAPADLPAPVDVPAPAVDATVPTPGPAGTSLEASGGTDPTIADQWAAAGSSAISQTASAAELAPPDAAALIRPVGDPAALPAAGLGAAAALPEPAVGVRPAGEERAALDASMGPLVHERVAALLAPAAAAGSAHSAAVAATRADAEGKVAAAEASTTAEQQAATSAAQAQVGQIHADWGAEKAGIIDEHNSAITAESSQVRTQATQAIVEANAQAKSQADQAEQSAPAGGQPAPEPGVWDRIKAAGKGAVSAIGNVAASVLSVIGSILDAARQRVVGMLNRLVDTVRQRVAAAVAAIRDGVRRVASAVADVISKAQALVTRLASALGSVAAAIWRAAAARVSELWQALQAAAGSALAAARAVVQKVASALASVKEILKVLASGLYSFIAEAYRDPQGKVVDPILAKVAPSAEGVPAQAGEVVQQNGPGGGAPAPTPAPSPAQRRVQRAPAPEAPPPHEGFWDGAWRHLKLAGAQFKEQWPTLLGKAILTILFMYSLLEEFPALWADLKATWNGADAKGDRLDHGLGICRHLVNIVANVVATVGVWALIIGLCGGPIAEAAIAGTYESISLTVIAADVVVGVAQMGKAAYGATRDEATPAERERYLSMFVASGIGLAITGIMVALGAIAVRLAGMFKAMRATAADVAVEAKAATTPVKPGDPAATPATTTTTTPTDTTPAPAATTPPPDTTTPIGDPTRVRPGDPLLEPRPREWPYSNPPDIQVVPPGTPLDLAALNPKVKYLWVVDEDGNFKFAPERQNSSDFMKPLPPDRQFSIKHGDLQPGAGGLSRGPARAGGELKNVPYSDGSPSDMWSLNNDSSYTFARVDADGNPLPWAPAESLEAVRNHLAAGGTNPDKLVTEDVLAADRLKAKEAAPN